MNLAGSSRALCVVIALALVVSGLGLLAGLAAAVPDERAVTPLERPLEEGTLTDGGTSVPSGRAVPMTRDEVRAWAEKLDLPTAQLAYLEDRFAGLDVSGRPGLIAPDDADEVMIHKADAAHALGFDGTGVRVGVIDTGVDFVHPDLFNVTLRITDPASDYFLHPVAYDGASLTDYLLFGEPASDSWWVNTSYSTLVEELGDGTQWVNWTDGVTTLSWNVTGEAGLATGEEVRLGFHPDDKLPIIYGMRPGVLLFNHSGAGPPYDHVLVDLDADMDFVGEKHSFINTDWASFDPLAEFISKDIDSDSVPDISGGMLTFIADGVREIPYASRQIDVLNLTFQMLYNDDAYDLWATMGVNPEDHLVPGSGDLVMLFGDFDEPGTYGAHGTWVTSAIVGQGTTGGGSVGPVLAGMAPGAKVIGSGNNFGTTDPFGQSGSLWPALIFMTEGYDGIPDTGDEAHLASNSWGAADWSGWEWGSRFADFVSTVMADERTLFAFSAGNSGPGYGGRQGPAGGASLLVSGAMQNYYYRDDPWYLYDGGPNPSYGDVTYFSHGPSAMGRHYTDALTNGMFGYGADPLNNNPFTADGDVWFNGSASWYLWAGTSLSTPNLAGVTALIYDAYMEAHFGLAPMASYAKAMVKNSADTARIDPFLSGAGIANALRGVLIANETEGVTTSIHEWNPGDYHGVEYASYANILFPESSDVEVVTVTNHDTTSAVTVTAEDAVLARTGSLFYNFTRTPGAPTDYFLLNDTGFFAADGTLLESTTPGLFTTADNIRVSLWFDIDRLGADEYPYYQLRAFDWTDVDANSSFDGSAERNLMTQDWISFDILKGPNGYVFVSDPVNRTHDGLGIWLNPYFEALMTSPLDFTVRVDYYGRSDFPWLTVTPIPLVIGPGSSEPLILDVSVPADADPGLYEAVVLLHLDTGNVTTIPVVVNVASLLPMSFGGNTYDSGPYQQGVQYGAVWTDDSASGDYRYYFFDLPEASKVSVQLAWDDPDSSNEIYVLGNVTDWFTETLPSRYGPGTQATIASQTESSNASSVTADLPAGLAIVVIRGLFIAGISVEEHPVGQVGTISVDPFPWIGVGVPPQGSETFTITSQIGFPDVAFTVETGQQLVYLDQPVDPFPFAGQDPWDLYLFEAPSTLKIEMGSGISKATYSLFFHSGARDVDMGIFYDDDCDGVYTVGDNQIGTQASTLSNPERGTILSPDPGCYWVHAAGYDVDPGSLYDLTVDLVEQPFLSVSSLPDSIDPGVPTEIVVDYSLPLIPQTNGGEFFVGSTQFPKAIAIPVSLTPDLPPILTNETPSPGAAVADSTPTISLDMKDWPDDFDSGIDTDEVEVLLDGIDVSGFAIITPTSMTLQLPFVLADGTHDVDVDVADNNGIASSTSWSFEVDTAAPSLVITSPTVAVTNDPEVRIEGETDPGTSVTVNGSAVSLQFPASFSTTVTLPDGTHSIDVVATDAAGNANTVTVDIEVDTVAPSVSISSPTAGTTTDVAAVSVQGTTEAGVTLTLNGIVVDVTATGSFSIELALSAGSNTIEAVATDAAGNSGSDSVSVTFENPIPDLEQNLGDTEADLATATATIGFLQTLVYVLLGVIAIVGAIAVVAMVMWWRGRGP